jgi:hypothetical protein
VRFLSKIGSWALAYMSAPARPFAGDACGIREHSKGYIFKMPVATTTQRWIEFFRTILGWTIVSRGVELPAGDIHFIPAVQLLIDRHSTPVMASPGPLSPLSCRSGGTGDANVERVAFGRRSICVQIGF